MAAGGRAGAPVGVQISAGAPPAITGAPPALFASEPPAFAGAPPARGVSSAPRAARKHSGNKRARSIFIGIDTRRLVDLLL